MTTVVLVPGSWEGGWIYHDVATQLRSRGHTVHAITLPGLDGGEPASGPVPNLDDHIDHVVEFIKSRDLREVVIAAHSYGGMVLRGLADAIPERCVGAVYIDAFLPERGESCFMLMGDLLREAVASLVSVDGRCVRPVPGSDPRSVPHPMASLLQASRAEGTSPGQRQAYIYASAWRSSPFTALCARLRQDPHWDTYDIDETHEVMRFSPLRVADLIGRVLGEWLPG